ncbi:MAG TPA: uroporphyrinogen decarboxylase family protein [Acidobacteriota bacterium]|nr:uroporphyrinogen decarboxylase family protein [Acidobacteriota bacterium]
MNQRESMASRQRVATALNHREADRIPIDLGGFQTGIHRQAYQTLIDYLGFDERLEMLDPVQQLVIPSERVLERFHVDVRYVQAMAPDGFHGAIEQNVRDGRLWHDLRDEFGVVWSMPDDQQLYMDISHHPLANAGLRDLEDYPFPKGKDPTRFRGLRERALALRHDTPYAISSSICGVAYEICWYMRGLERWFVDMKENPDFCTALLDKISRYWVDWLTCFLAEVGDILDVVMIGDDLAGQHGPLFSPSFYRSVVKPRQQRITDTIKRLTKAKIWYHTCGSCVEYIPDLLDNGIDILNPVQISARNMDPASLKERFGKRLAFWGGGIDAQHVLPFRTPEEVKREAVRNINALKQGGGYVFSNVHNIQAGVPPENIVALYDAAYEFGFYE